MVTYSELAKTSGYHSKCSVAGEYIQKYK